MNAFTSSAAKPLSARGALTLAAAALCLAALSVVLWPTQLVNDPNVWLVWARQLTHGGIVSAGGQSSAWKPLPVFVLAPLAAVSPKAAAVAWLVIARTAAIATTVLLFRSAGRVGGWVGGIIAGLVPLLFDVYERGLSGGMCEPLVLAFLLLAIEAHAGSHRRVSLWLGFCACLMRPELAPVLGAYGIWLIRTEGRRAVPAVVGAVAGLALAWLGSMWLLFDDPIQIIHRAQGWPHESKGFLRLASTAVGDPWQLAGVIALGFGGLWFAIKQRDRVVLAAAALGAGWLLIAGLIEATGSPAVPRYLLGGLTLLCVLVGAGAGGLIASAPSKELAAFALLFTVVAVAWPAAHRADLALEIFRDGHELRSQTQAAESAIKAAGGVPLLLACAPVTANAALTRTWPYGLLAAPMGFGARVMMRTVHAPTLAIVGPAGLAGRPPGHIPGETHRTLTASRNGWYVIHIAGAPGDRHCPLPAKTR